MTTEEIYMLVRCNLTGDHEQDLAFLKEQREIIRDRENARQLRNACECLGYRSLSEETGAVQPGDTAGGEPEYVQVLEDVRAQMSRGEYGKGLDRMQPVMEAMETSARCREYEAQGYHSFHTFFEKALYMDTHRSEKKVRCTPVPYDTICLQYAALLMALDRPGDARRALKKALKWNPVSADIALSYVETFRMQGDYGQVLKLTIPVFRFAFRPYQVACCFRNLGDAFLEKEAWQAAMGCYTLSMKYEDAPVLAMTSAFYIREITGAFPECTQEDMKRIADLYHFPVDVHPKVLELLCDCASHALDRKKYDHVRYFLEALYELTKMEKIREFMDTLPETGNPSGGPGER